MQPDGAGMLSARDLGLEDEDFVVPEQAWAKMDWSSIRGLLWRPRTAGPRSWSDHIISSRH